MKGIFMKKLCLTLLLLNTIFAAKEEDPMKKFKRERIELFSHAQKRISNKHENVVPDTQPDYEIYNDVFQKCKLIEDILTRKYESNLLNTHDIGFHWEKISNAYALYLIENKIDEKFILQLNKLSAQVDIDEQQKINNFLDNFRICKRKTYTLCIHDICHLIDSIMDIKEITFHRIAFLKYKKFSYIIL